MNASEEGQGLYVFNLEKLSPCWNESVHGRICDKLLL